MNRTDWRIRIACVSCGCGLLRAAAPPPTPATQPATPATAASRAPATPPAAVNPRDRPAVQRLFHSWNLPVRPRRLVGNVYYVGASGVSSFLVTTPRGHVLIDTGFEQTVPLIQKSIADLGFREQDIKYLLSSHAHADHTGGHALMKRLTGATIVASAADAKILETGGEDDFSPFPKDLMRYTPVKPDRIVKDGDTVSIDGEGGVTLTAHLTPGHTKGATTWTTEVTEDGRRLHVVFFSSVSIADGTRLVGNAAYPTIADDYRATFAKLKALPCDVFLAPHGGQFAMSGKFTRLDRGEKPNPLIDPDGWRRTITEAERAFLEQLEREGAGAAGR